MKLTLKKLGPNFSHLLLNKELKDNKINFVDLENVSLAIKLLAKNFLLTTIHPDKLERYHPRPPLKTSTLQQEAINNFKISSRMVEQIAQKLYEGVEIFGQMESLITYPRTDQTVMSEVFIATAQKYLTKTYGKEYVALAVPLQATKTNEAKKQQLIQGAHEAIRPTNLNLTPQIVKPFLDQRAYQIYSLIWVRSLGWLMNPSIYCYKYFDFVNNSCLFQSYTRTRNFAGFELIYNQYGFKDNDSNQEVDFSLVKKLVVNQQYLADEINGVKHNKKPPSRYNEASLIQALEKNGIGRPSTYAAITATVLARDYATKVKGSLIPNEKGIKIIDGLSRLFQEIVSFDYTRKMEENLDAIANEEINWKEDFLKPTFAKFNQQLNKAKENQPKPAPVILDRKCPKCDQNLIHRMGVGKWGKFNFIGCSNYPNCNYLEQIKNQVNKVPSSKLDFNCPRCGKQLLKKKSRYNTFFVGCCDYPKCTYAMDYKKFCLQHHLEIKKEEEENE